MYHSVSVIALLALSYIKLLIVLFYFIYKLQLDSIMICNWMF